MVYNGKYGMILPRQNKMMQVSYILLQDLERTLLFSVLVIKKCRSDLRVRQERESAVDSRVMNII